MSVKYFLLSLKFIEKLIETNKMNIFIKRFPEISANGYRASNIKGNNSKDFSFCILLLVIINWLRGTDLNRRPSGYEPDELPDCSTPRYN